MKMKQGFLPAERRAISLLASLYAVRMLGLFMVLPVFFIQGTGLEGATPELLGLAMGAYGLSQAMLQVPFGMLSDRFGRKPLLFVGLMIFITGSIVAALSESVYGVIFGRFLQGAGAIASVLMALISDLTREEQRTKAMAFVGMSIGLSFAVALVIGPVISAYTGLSGLFWVTAGLATIGLVLITKLPDTLTRKRHLDTTVVMASVKQALSSASLIRLNIGIFSLHLVMTALFVAVPKTLITEFQIDPANHGYYYLLVMALAFVTMVPLIIMGERKRQVARIFQIAVLVLAVSMMLEAWVKAGFLVFTFLLFLFFVAFNYLEATLPSLVSKVASAGTRGTAMGLYSSAQFFGAFMGGVLGGLAYAKGGIEYVYLLCAGVGGVWCLVNIRMPEPPYTASMVLRLKAFTREQAEKVRGDLSQITGVQDVTLVVGESLAYLKIDRQHLDENTLFNHPLAVRTEE